MELLLEVLIEDLKNHRYYITYCQLAVECLEKCFVS